MHSYIQRHRQDSLDCQSDAVKHNADGSLYTEQALTHWCLFWGTCQGSIDLFFLTKGEFMHAHTQTCTQTHKHILLPSFSLLDSSSVWLPILCSALRPIVPLLTQICWDCTCELPQIQHPWPSHWFSGGVVCRCTKPVCRDSVQAVLDAKEKNCLIWL